MMKNMVIYLLAVNFITFLLYGDDKSRARRHAWRIPEKVLMGAAVIGGSIGALLGMSIFHHKTRKPKFYIGIPLILLIEFGLAAGYGIQVDISEQTVENNSENMQEKRIKTCQEH